MKRTRRQAEWVVVIAATMALALVVLPRATQAYEVSGVGGSIGYATPENLDGTTAVGLHAVLERPGTRLHLDPNMRVWNVDGVRDVAPNMDVTYHFTSERRWTPYVGGGLGVNFVHDRNIDRSSSDLGMNVIGGVRFPAAANRYFVEGRYTASDVNQVALVTGITFHAP